MIIRDIVVQSLSRVQLCNPTESSMPGSSVPHYLLELAQTHVHWVGDDIQPFHPVFPFSSCPQSFPASGSFPASWLFASDGQSIGASASASVLPMNIQGWFPFGLTGLVSRNNSGVCLIFSYMGLILIWCLCSWLPHPCVIDTRKCMYTHGGIMSMYGKTNTIL